MASPHKQFTNYPRQGNFEEKRWLILQEAARLFAEKGVQETSLGELADLFKISKPALYHYGKSKDAIIAQILTSALDNNMKMLERVKSSDASGQEKLREALKFYALTMNTHIGRCLATLQVSNNFSKSTNKLHRNIHRTLLDEFVSLVEEGVADGSLKHCDSKIIVLHILHAFNGVARWHHDKGPLSLEEIADEMIDTFFWGIAAD